MDRVFKGCSLRGFSRFLKLCRRILPRPAAARSKGIMRPFQIAALIALLASIGGCMLPPALTIASFVADGISMASSGKTVTDQAVSVLLQKDCRLWRLVQGKSICGSDTSVVAVAALPPPVPLRAASPGLRPTEPFASAVAAPVEALPTESAPAPEAQFPTLVPATATPELRPAASSSPVATAAPAAATPPPRILTALSATSLRARPPSVAAVPPPMRHAARDARMRGEMVIRSGTDETEARALADSLHAVGATVRPVHQGDITIYEVVMGLSG